MKRRDLLYALGNAALGWPLVSHAQQADRMQRVGVLMGYPESDSVAQLELAAFVQELQKLGWADRRNLRTDTRWASPADAVAMKRSAQELVALQPDVILASSTLATTALLQQTRTIPIVFAGAGDPIGSGFVASFRRPGGNVTGFTLSEATQAGKLVQLLKEIAPGITRVAILFNPEMAPFAEYWLNPFRAATAALAVKAVAAPVHEILELDSVVAAQAHEPNSGIIVMPDSFMHIHRVEITSLAARYRLPAVYPNRMFAEVGGLLSYGVNFADNWRRAATYVDRILKGAKPGDLPVQAPDKFELVINLKTAKALDLTIPPSLLATADEVIE